jgi:hypothetical protein
MGAMSEVNACECYHEKSFVACLCTASHLLRVPTVWSCTVYSYMQTHAYDNLLP